MGLISRDRGRTGEPGGFAPRGVSNFFHFVDEVLVTSGLGLDGRGVVV